MWGQSPFLGYGFQDAFRSRASDFMAIPAESLIAYTPNHLGSRSASGPRLLVSAKSFATQSPPPDPSNRVSQRKTEPTKHLAIVDLGTVPVAGEAAEGDCFFRSASETSSRWKMLDT